MMNNILIVFLLCILALAIVCFVVGYFEYRRGFADGERRIGRAGKWLQISPAGIYECSACGQNVMTDDIDAYRWCHGCGAKMFNSANH